MININFDIDNSKNNTKYGQLVMSGITLKRFFNNSLVDRIILESNFMYYDPSLLPYPIYVYTDWAIGGYLLLISPDDMDIFNCDIDELFRTLSLSLEDNKSNVITNIFSDFKVISYEEFLFEKDNYNFNQTACCKYSMKGIMSYKFLHTGENKIAFKCKNLDRDILIYYIMGGDRSGYEGDFYKDYSRFYIGTRKSDNMDTRHVISHNYGGLVDEIGLNLNNCYGIEI